MKCKRYNVSGILFYSESRGVGAPLHLPGGAHGHHPLIVKYRKYPT